MNKRGYTVYAISKKKRKKQIECQFYNVVNHLLELREIEEQLKFWFIQSKDTFNSLTKLLSLIRRPVLGLVNLPKTVAAIRGTRHFKYEIKKIAALGKKGAMGDIVYYGVENGLKRIIDIENHYGTTIFCQFGFDGAPLNNRGSLDGWPLICRVYDRNLIYEPFILSLYTDPSHPKNIDEFFEPK